MVQAIHSAVNPLNTLGVTASYQNEGSVWETNWQEGKEYHMLITRTFPYTNLFSYHLKFSLVTSTASCSRSNRNMIPLTVRHFQTVLLPFLILCADGRCRRLVFTTFKVR